MMEACVRQRFEKRSATRRKVFVMNRTGSFQNSTGVSVREPPQPRSLHFKLSWRQRSCDPVMGAERIVRVRHQYIGHPILSRRCPREDVCAAACLAKGSKRDLHSHSCETFCSRVADAFEIVLVCVTWWPRARPPDTVASLYALHTPQVRPPFQG